MCLAFRLGVACNLMGELLQSSTLLIGHRPQKKQKSERKSAKKKYCGLWGLQASETLRLKTSPLCPLCVPSFNWPVALFALHIDEERKGSALS